MAMVSVDIVLSGMSRLDAPVLTTMIAVVRRAWEVVISAMSVRVQYASTHATQCTPSALAEVEARVAINSTVLVVNKFVVEDAFRL